MLGWFRRHAKILMVVLGSAAMAIFGLGPVFDELAQRGARGNSAQDEVVATWDGGKITRANLQIWESNHYGTQRFLRGVREAAMEKKGGEEFLSLATPIMPIQDGVQEAVDEQLVSRFLLSEKAKAEGILVSDGMIEDYIALSSGDAGFSNKDLQLINREVNQQSCSLQTVREHLKFEILASQMQQYASAGIPLVPNPTEAIELYARSAEQVECEVLPINVEDYLTKPEVADSKPSASELKKTYEAGKYDFPDPTAENPGFKIGRKVNVQYLKADYEAALKREMAKISDEDVQVEYDRLVKEKNPLVMEAIKIEDDSITIEGTPPSTGATPSDVTPPPTGGAAPSDVSPPPAEGGADGSATKPGTPVGGAIVPGTPAIQTPAIETPTGNETLEVLPGGNAVPTLQLPGPPGETTPAVPSGGGQSSFKVTKSKFQFVSTTIQEPAAPAQATKQPSPPVAAESELAIPAQTSEPVVQTQTPVTQTPVTQAPATTQTTETPSTPPANLQQEESVGGLTEIMEDADSSTPAETKPDDRKPKPLKEVAEDIRRSIAEPLARKAMEESVAKAGVFVQVHFEKVIRNEYDSTKKDEPVEPIDLEEIAKKYDLTVHETGLVDDVEIMKDPIGALGVPMEVMYGGRRRRTVMPVGQLIFDRFNELKPYDSQTADDMWVTQSSFLFWITDKADTRVPSFTECEADVVSFLQKKKAYELAMAEAMEMKKKVNTQRNKTLAEMFGDKAVPTGAFTWFTNFGSAQYSNPNGVKVAGEEFMKTAFSLAEKEAGVAPNASKDVIYLIQATQPARPSSEAGEDFLTNKYFKFKRIPTEAFQISQRYTRDFSLSFNEELQKSMGFKFIDR